MTLYRDIIGNALRLAWRYKYLWVFAFFAALAGNGGEYELAFSGTDSVNGQTILLGFLRQFYENGTWGTVLGNLRDFFTSSPALAILLALLILCVFLVIIWLVIVAHAALTWGVAQTAQGKRPSFSETFGMGVRYFSPVFWVNVATKAVVVLLILAVAAPLGIAYIRTGGETFNAYYVLVMFLILVPITIVLSFIVKYATTYIVLRTQGWRMALTNGWRLFTRNWLVSLETALALFLINLITTLVLVLLLFILGIPKNVIGTITFFTILTLYGVFMAAFQYSSWVLLFLQLDGGRVESSLNRWAASLSARRTPPPQSPQQGA